MNEISPTDSCAKLLNFKDKRDILQEEKRHKNKKLYLKKKIFKRNFRTKKRTLE